MALDAMQRIGRLGDESGVTGIEYGLLAAVIVLLGMVAFTAFGQALVDLYLHGVVPIVEALRARL